MQIPDQSEWTDEGDQEKMAYGLRMTDRTVDKREVWHSICDKYGGNKDAFEWGTRFFFDWSLEGRGLLFHQSPRRGNMAGLATMTPTRHGSTRSKHSRMLAYYHSLGTDISASEVLQVTL